LIAGHAKQEPQNQRSAVGRATRWCTTILQPRLKATKGGGITPRVFLEFIKWLGKLIWKYGIKRVAAAIAWVTTHWRELLRAVAGNTAFSVLLWAMCHYWGILC